MVLPRRLRTRIPAERLHRLARAGACAEFFALDRLCPPPGAAIAGTLLRFGGGRLAVFHWGSGPPILLVHGWGGHSGELPHRVSCLLEAAP